MCKQHFLICVGCGESFKRANEVGQRPKYCSVECRSEHVKRARREATRQRRQSLPQEKSCGSCGEIKELSLFDSDGRRPDGRSAECTQCRTVACKVDECDSRSFLLGFCQKHYYRFKNHGTTDLHPRFTDRHCSVGGCEGKATRKGLCSKHYSRLTAYGTTAKREITCGIDGCQEKPIKTVCKGGQKKRVCAAHLDQHRVDIAERKASKAKNKDESLRTCRQCGDLIPAGTKTRGYTATIHCSPRCVSRERDGKPDKEPCVICGTLFKAINGRKVCSDACQTIKSTRATVECRRRTQYHKRNYKGDSNYRLARIVRSLLHRVLKATGQDKNEQTFDALGYSTDELRSHIERQFTRGMSWDLVGPEVHIDHIIPVAEFIRQGETRAEVINALPNLRPMWAKQNMLKKDRVVSLL